MRIMPYVAARTASRDEDAGHYQRHRPEQTLLYQIVNEYYPAFAAPAAKIGAVTLIQRFGSALNLNIHFHMLCLDGVYVDRPDGTARFRWIKAPTSQELTKLAHTIAPRGGRFLEANHLEGSEPKTGVCSTAVSGRHSSLMHILME
jgi:hypothetical protein